MGNIGQNYGINRVKTIKYIGQKVRDILGKTI